MKERNPTETSMLGSVFMKSLRDLRWQLLWWGGGLAALSGLTVVIYPSFEGVLEVQGLVESLPPALQKLIESQANIATLPHFLSLKLFDSWLPIVLSVFAIVQGAAAIAGEEEQGTLDFLMALPLRRWRVVLEKFAAVATALVVMAVMIGVALVGCTWASGQEADAWTLIGATFNLIPIALAFGAMALTGSCFFHHRRPAVGIPVAVMITSYFIYLLGPITSVARPWLRYSLFHYYGRSEPIVGTVEVTGLLVVMVVLLTFLGVALYAMERKDLTV